MDIKYKGESYFLYNKGFEYSETTVVCKADLINVAGGDKIEVSGKALQASAAYLNMLDRVYGQLGKLIGLNKKKSVKQKTAEVSAG